MPKKTGRRAKGGESLTKADIDFQHEDDIEALVEKVKQSGKYRVSKSDEYDAPYQQSTPRYNQSFQYAPAAAAQPPRVSSFSGEEPTPKGEVSFKVWRYEIRSLLNDRVYPEALISQAIRKSLRGPASKVLLSLGEGAQIGAILHKFEGIFGNVYSGESIMQQFYTEQQQQQENVASWACRLEDLLQNAVDKGHVSETSKNDMLRNKFWTGLTNTALKNASRHKYDTETNFDQLLRDVRMIEQELAENDRIAGRHKSSAVTAHHCPLTSDIQDMS